MAKQISHEKFVNRVAENNPNVLILGQYVNAKTRVRVQCLKCEQIYDALPSKLMKGKGCPYCSNQKIKAGYNDLATTHPQIASEWCYERNDVVTPRDVTHGSEKVVWWKCQICGCEYQASVASRTNTHSSKKCPQCSSQHGTSFREQCVLFYMRQALNCPVESRAQVKMCEQHKEIDIWIPSLMIGLEYDGEYYHENAIRDRNDSGKDNLAKSSGIRLIRIIESDHKEFNGDRVTYDVHHDRTKNLQEAIEHAINLIVPYQNAIDINADTSLIMQQYKNDEGERSLTHRYPELAEEWDIELNNGLTPDKVSYGSGYNAWWRCCHGHAYQSTVNNRTHLNSGCPYCSNKKVLTGFNDLATRFPSIAEEWHPTKNDGKHTPETIVFGSHLKVWWKCKTCGNEWETTISDRIHGTGCPVCAGRDIKQGYNDFATNFPEIAAEWHPTRNENLQPSDVTSHSHRKVWWVDKFGHEWKATIANRTNGNGCPYCNNRKILSGYNDLATIAPEVAREWHPTKNGELTPDMVFPKSGKKRFWKCSKCGTEYENIVSNITNGLSGCPNCRYKPGKQTKTIY